MTEFDHAFQGEEGKIAVFIHEHPECIRQKNDKGRTLLLCAAAGGRTSIVELIHDFAPDLLDVPDQQGMTPVYHAAMGNHLCTMKFLIKHGCNIHALDDQGKSPLYASIEFKAKRTFNYLLECDSKLAMIKTIRGYLPIHIAVDVNNSAALKMLLRLKLTKEERTRMILASYPGTSDTPLHKATLFNLNRCVNILLEDDIGRQATLMVNTMGHRPIGYALLSNNALIIGMLVRSCHMDMALLMNCHRVASSSSQSLSS